MRCGINVPGINAPWDECSLGSMPRGINALKINALWDQCPYDEAPGTKPPPGTLFGGRGGQTPLILKNSDYFVFLPTIFFYYILPPLGNWSKSPPSGKK